MEAAIILTVLIKDLVLPDKRRFVVLLVLNGLLGGGWCENGRNRSLIPHVDDIVAIKRQVFLSGELDVV